MSTFTATGGVRFTDTTDRVSFVAGYQSVSDSGGGGGATDLDDLTDVVITAAASGDILRHNGTNWVDTPGTDHFEPAGAVSTHSSDTTSVHGIADTSVLETTTGAQAKVDTHVNDTTAAHAASAISVDAGGFNGNLGTGDDTVQKVAQKLDDLVTGGTVDVVSNVATNTILGRTTAGSGNSEELSASQVRTLLKTPQSSDDTVLDIRVLTQAAYDAIGSPSATTLYFING